MRTCDATASRHLVGDPINVVTGANTFREVDFELDGPLEVFFYRYYDSRWHREDRGLGFGFRHGFEHWLVFDLDGVTYREPDGTARHFRHFTYDGERQASGGCWLERVDSERFVLSRHAQPTLVFRRPAGAVDAELVEMRQLVDGHEERVALKYDSRGRLSHVLAPRDETLKLEWDAENHIHGVQRWTRDGARDWCVRYHYQSGYLVAAVDPYKHTFRLGYDSAGRVAQRTDRRGYSFYFTYDAAGRCIASHGEDGAVSVQLTYKPLEYETRVLDANGAEWIYQFTPAGVVTLITDPLGGVRYFELGEDGRVEREYDAKGACTTYVYDDAGAAIAKVDPDGNRIALPEPPKPQAPRPHRVPRLPIEWELGDLWERGFKLPDPHEIPFELPPEVRQALTTSDNPLRGTVATIHDVHGQRLREEVETGHARQYVYNENGGLARVVDMCGSTWTIEVASWNDIVAETDPLGGRTTYGYSSTREIASVTDAAGTHTEYTRDLKDRITQVRRNGQIRGTYAYDAGDHLIEKRDANGEVLLEIARDPAGRAVERKLASGQVYRFRYDDRGRVIEARGLRHTCTFAYDRGGQRTEDKRDGKGVVHRFIGDLRSTTVLERFRTEYRRSGKGSLWITDPVGGTHELKSHGRGLFTRHFANGLSETTQYHPRGGRVLAKVLYAKGAPGHDWARRYVYGPEGTLDLVIDSERGPTRHEHDAALRLAKTLHPDGRVDEYKYNAAGTLYQSPTLGQATAGAANRLRYANGEQYEYDHRHNLSRRVSSRGTIQYDFDSNDQLAGVFWQGPEGQTWGWDAEYDGLGRRIRKAPGYTNDTRYYWDTDRLAAEVFSDGRVRVYVYPDAFAMVPLLFIDYESEDADPASGRRYYVLTDQRGCVERMLDDIGTIVWAARVDPYGFAHIDVGAGFHQPLRFPGHWFDAETGLHYNRFRYYDPAGGRYLQSDPMGLRGGPNLYAYTDNPLTQVDLRGLSHKTRTEDDPDSSEGHSDGERSSEPPSQAPHERQPSRGRNRSHKRGDHVFAHGLRKAVRSLREMADRLPDRAADRVRRAADEMDSALDHPAFDMTTDTGEPPEGGDDHSRRFGEARRTQEDAQERFSDAIENAETAPSDQQDQANRALDEAGRDLNDAWSEVADAAEDPAASDQFTSKADRSTIEGGRNQLDAVRSSVSSMTSDISDMYSTKRAD